MATEITMPRLSDSMEEGTILKWLKAEGDEVKRDEPLAEIETDKANMTYEADVEGTLVQIVAGEGDTVPLGEVIARIGDPSEVGGNGSDGGGQAATSEDTTDTGVDVDTTGAANATQTEPSGNGGGADVATEPAPAPSGGGDGDGRTKASPVARRIAEEMGVSLSGLTGSGPGGRIVKADVLAAAENGAGQAQADGAADQGQVDLGATETAAPSAPAEEQAAPAGREESAKRGEPVSAESGPKGDVTVEELSRLQKTVARRMAEAKATAPDFQLEVEIDMTEAVALRAQLKTALDPAPSFNDMVVKAVALALREYPRANGQYKDGTFELFGRVNVGIAVAAQDSLMVPTLFDADKKSIGAISREARQIIGKVRDNTITPPELGGGTFTISNLGMFGIERFTAVINPPQAGILAVGAMVKRPTVMPDGRIAARDRMVVRLSADHRILYGSDAAGFLTRIKELLEKPLALAM